MNINRMGINDALARKRAILEEAVQDREEKEDLVRRIGVREEPAALLRLLAQLLELNAKIEAAYIEFQTVERRIHDLRYVNGPDWD